MSVVDKLRAIIEKGFGVDPLSHKDRWYPFYRQWPARSRYVPHHGEQECARRVRQMERDDAAHAAKT